MKIFRKMLVLLLIMVLFGTSLSMSVSESNGSSFNASVRYDGDENKDSQMYPDPVACFEWSPLEPEAYETIIFDASCSYAPGLFNSIVSYDWSYTTVNEPHFPIHMGEGEIIEYHWQQSGSYCVQLTVVDKQGESDSIAHIIEVVPENRRPNTPVVQGPSLCEVGVTYEYAVCSYDPDNDDIRYGWDWNNDFVVETTDWSTFGESGFIHTVEHTWWQSGDQVINVVAEDVKGKKCWSEPFEVFTNCAPEIPQTPMGPSSGNPGKEYMFKTKTFDPDGNSLWYQWDWGDGTSSEWIGPLQSDVLCYKSHVWNLGGSYSVRVKAKDGLDFESEWSEPLVVAMPKNKMADRSLFSFLEYRFPLFSWMYDVVEYQ